MAKIKFNFENENFVVTGASSGMGRQIALELAEAGAKVLAIARRSEELKKLQADFPDNIIVASLDVCDYKAVEDSINNFVKDYGKINGAVHAAGINFFTPLRMYDEKVAKKVMDVGFWAGAKLIQICSKSKNANKNASFLLFSSVCSQKTDKGLFGYAASKAAIKVAVKSFAKEIAGKGMRINTISPGWVQTGMTNSFLDTHNLDEVNKSSILGLGEPEDVSGMVLFLLSDRAKWITGTDVVVDGGYLL